MAPTLGLHMTGILGGSLALPDPAKWPAMSKISGAWSHGSSRHDGFRVSKQIILLKQSSRASFLRALTAAMWRGGAVEWALGREVAGRAPKDAPVRGEREEAPPPRSRFDRSGRLCMSSKDGRDRKSVV